MYGVGKPISDAKKREVEKDKEPNKLIARRDDLRA